MPSKKQLDVMFINIAKEYAELSNCVSFKVGAVIVKNDRIVSSGYNGCPSGTYNCSELFPDYDKNNPEHTKKHHQFSEKFEIHSEMNALLFSAKTGISIDGGTLYCTLLPCNNCLKNICQSGIKRIVYKEIYKRSNIDAMVFHMLQKSKVSLEALEFKNSIPLPGPLGIDVDLDKLNLLI